MEKIKEIICPKCDGQGCEICQGTGSVYIDEDGCIIPKELIENPFEYEPWKKEEWGV